MRAKLDLPTTDPGSDVHFSTDEEETYNQLAQIDFDGAECKFGTLPKTRRILMQSELQRRYIEEIGDGNDILKRMPPELIVTSPSKLQQTPKPICFTYRSSMSTAATVIHQIPMKLPTSAGPLPPKTAPTAKGLLGEFPVIECASRRTNSWHNLHNNGKVQMQKK